MRNWLWVVVLSLITVLVIGIVVGIVLFAPSNIQAAEVTTSSPVTWECSKFSYYLGINENLSASLSLDQGYVNETVLLGSWSERVTFGLNITANLRQGYIENLNTTCQGDCLASTVEFFDLGNLSGKYFTAEWKNLTVRTYDDYLRGSTLKAYISLNGANNPKEVSSHLYFVWSVNSPQNQTEQLTLDVEATYFNGTVVKKVIQPFQITLQRNDNKSFETAREIQANQTIRGSRNLLAQEFYKVQVNNGATLNVTLNNMHGFLGGENLSLYSPDDLNRTLRTDSAFDHDYPLSVQYTADSTGYLYIKVDWWAGSDIYLLTVTTYD
jgi:hypothetical protein